MIFFGENNSRLFLFPFVWHSILQKSSKDILYSQIFQDVRYLNHPCSLIFPLQIQVQVQVQVFNSLTENTIFSIFSRQRSALGKPHLHVHYTCPIGPYCLIPDLAFLYRCCPAVILLLAILETLRLEISRGFYDIVTILHYSMYSNREKSVHRGTKCCHMCVSFLWIPFLHKKTGSAEQQQFAQKLQHRLEHHLKLFTGSSPTLPTYATHPNALPLIKTSNFY